MKRALLGVALISSLSATGAFYAALILATKATAWLDSEWQADL